MNKKVKRILVIIIILTGLIWCKQDYVNASNQYLSIEKFAAKTVQELKIGKTYSDAITLGLVNERQFDNRYSNITNEQAAVILHNAWIIAYGSDNKYDTYVNDFEKYFILRSPFVEGVEFYTNFDWVIRSAKAIMIEGVYSSNSKKYISYFRSEIRDFIKDRNFSAVSDWEYLLALLKAENEFSYSDFEGYSTTVQNLYYGYNDDCREHSNNVPVNKELLEVVRKDENFNDYFIYCKLLKQVKDNKRISDIYKVKKENRDAVYNMYARGIISGYSNGAYSSDRSFKPESNTLIADAETWIKRLARVSECHTLSPDGRLIRTTNLPYNYKDYPYILQDFPNEWYTTARLNSYENRFIEDYIYMPIKYITSRDQLNPKIYVEANFALNDPVREVVEYEDEINKFMEVAKKNLELRFNISYKDMNYEWMKELHDTYFAGDYQKIRSYVYFAQKHKIQIKSNKIVVEKTGNNGTGYRCYVEFKISWDGKPDYTNELIFSHDFNNLLGLKKGKLMRAYIELDFSSLRGAEFLGTSGFGCRIYQPDSGDGIYTFDYIKEYDLVLTAPIECVKYTNIDSLKKQVIAMSGEERWNLWKDSYRNAINYNGYVYFWKYVNK